MKVDFPRKFPNSEYFSENFCGPIQVFLYRCNAANTFPLS